MGNLFPTFSQPARSGPVEGRGRHSRLRPHWLSAYSRRQRMGESARAALTSEKRTWLSPGVPWWQHGVLLLLLGWLYGPILTRLFAQWVHDPDFSHGVFVPLFAAYIVWLSRDRLRHVEPSPSWTGLPIIILALLALTMGVLGAELFFSRSSLLLLLAGLVV